MSRWAEGPGEPHELRALVVAAVLAAAACAAASSQPDRPPDGVWGGDHVEVTTASTSASFQFDCAHGSVEGPIRLGADGTFASPGVFVAEKGGPVREGETEPTEPAVYVGRLEERELRFTIRLPNRSAQIGPFTAVLGAPARLVRCL